jgi:hypothetical protein
MPATTTELTGVFKSGRVELDTPADFPDGTRMRFVPLEYIERLDEPIVVAAPSQPDRASPDRNPDPC